MRQSTGKLPPFEWAGSAPQQALLSSQASSASIQGKIRAAFGQTCVAFGQFRVALGCKRAALFWGCARPTSGPHSGRVGRHQESFRPMFVSGKPRALSLAHAQGLGYGPGD